MIVAAGLGTRLQPLTRLVPKPAVPVRGIPLIGYSLALLAASGVDEVVINLHHMPGKLEAAARRWCPAGLALHFSHEPELLHTGGAIRRVVDFLRESDPCVVLGGDMILDLDLPALLSRHRASGRAATLLLCDDAQADRFGTIGLDEAGGLRRVAGRFDLGGETRAGVYTWLNLFSPAAFESLPGREVFNHLDDWLAPRAREVGDVGGEIGDKGLIWVPVGTMTEYVDANFVELSPRYLDVAGQARERGVRLSAECVIGAGADVPDDARLERVVVWDDEKIPRAFEGRRGVFAGGAFHSAEASA